jgi:hypothetical protein
MDRRSITALGATLVAGTMLLVASGCGSGGGTTAATTTTTTTVPVAGLTAENCRRLIDLPVTFTDAVTGLLTDLDEANAVLTMFATRAPFRIRPDFAVLKAASAKISSTLKGVDLSGNKALTPAALTKLRRLEREVDTAKVTAASSNIAIWARETCPAVK